MSSSPTTVSNTTDTGTMSDGSSSSKPVETSLTGGIVSEGVISVPAQPTQHPHRPAPLDMDIVPLEQQQAKPSLQTSLPLFPFLQGGATSQKPGPLYAPTIIAAAPIKVPSKALQLCGIQDIQNIAKEALRLTKETLLHENQRGPAASGYHHHLNRTVSDHHAAAPRANTSMALPKKASHSSSSSTGLRLNKFVRRLHDMLLNEMDSGIVEWRRGLLVLQNTNVFAKEILPKYFNTRNFKTFRRQLNYYGFVHVRSFSNTASSSYTTALWVNRELAKTASTAGTNPDDISSVLLLKRVEPCESAKTAEERRVRKELAMSTVEDDLGVSAKALQMQQIRCSMTASAPECHTSSAHDIHHAALHQPHQVVMLEHHNYNTSISTSLILPASTSDVALEIQCATNATTNFPVRLRTVSTSENTSDTSDAPKPPSSSTSVANLLLLLSKA